MLDFAKLKQSAHDLSKKMNKSYSSQMGCFNFFSSYISNTCTLEDVSTIGMIARSLQEDNDIKLLNYIKDLSGYSSMTKEELISFKCKILIGIYLLIWSQYSSVSSNLMYQSLIQFFQQTLEIRWFHDMDDHLFNSSLSALSQYSSFIYENRMEQPVFADLNKRLGAAIQADIETARYKKQNKPVSWFETCSEMLSTLGMKKMT